MSAQLVVGILVGLWVLVRVVGRQITGSLVTQRQLVLMPAILLVLGVLSLSSTIHGASAGELAFLGLDCVVLIGLGFARAGGVHKKDTLRNIEYRREFVIHSVTEDVLHQVVATARSAPAGESKARGTGLTLVPSTAVGVPRIAECAASMECRCEQVTRIGAGHDLVTARVVAVHLDSACFPGGQPDYERFRPVGRLHGEFFATLGEVIHLPRTALQSKPIASDAPTPGSVQPG